jgi:hypothetical protein
MAPSEHPTAVSAPRLGIRAKNRQQLARHEGEQLSGVSEGSGGEKRQSRVNALVHIAEEHLRIQAFKVNR